MKNPMVKPINDEKFLRMVSQGQTTKAITDAMLDLNKSGRTVNFDGAIEIAGEKIPLRVRNGSVVALVDNVSIPWGVFRTTLKRTHT